MTPFNELLCHYGNVIGYEKRYNAEAVADAPSDYYDRISRMRKTTVLNVMQSADDDDSGYDPGGIDFD